MRARRLIVTAAIAVAIGGAALAAFRGTHRGRHAAAGAFGLPLQGKQFTVSFTQELRSHDGPPKQVRVDGILQSTGSPPGATSPVRVFRLVDVKVTPGAGAAPANAAQEFAAGAARPFLVTYQRDRPESASFAPDVGPNVRNLLLAVVVAFPSGRPTGASPSVTSERDLFGRYLAALQPDADGLGFQQRKLKYLDLDVPGARTSLKTAVAITIGGSDWHYRFEPNGALAQIEGDERATVETGVPGLAPEVRSVLRVAAQGTFDAGPMLDEVEASRATLVPTAVVTQKVEATANGRSADEELVAGATLTQLLPPLLAPTAGGHPTLAERHTAIERMAALVRLQPSTARELQTKMAAAPAQSLALVQALGRANSAEARQVLRDLATNSAAPREARLAAVHALAPDDPEAATLTAMTGLFDAPDSELREAAVYCYGTALGAWRKRDPAAASAALDALVARLEKAPDDPQRILALRGLGNAADPSTLPALRRALAAPQAPVRNAAVQALRNVMAPEVDPAIIAVMRGDPSADVRAAALFSAGFRDVTTYADAAAELALHDPSAVVRGASVDLLGRTLATAPRSRTVLEEVARKDAKPDVRKRARQILEAPRPTGR
jgi:hypothetical protein